MKYVLDTSAFSAFNRGDVRLERYLRSEHEILVPLVVIAELRAGFALGSRRAENDRILERLLNSSNVTVVSLNDETANVYADVFLRQREVGRPVGANDMWIAASAIERDLPVLTLDHDFDGIVGLKVVEL
ncbi:PIN domain-containing protein [Candidatus Saccharibacteria bacterium]|nr:PIN domain-containing protein [Candidatus Saccharibacteria bacterium]